MLDVIPIPSDDDIEECSSYHLLVQFVLLPGWETQIPRLANDPVLRGQAVEQVEPREVAGVELVVQRVAQVVLDDRLGQSRLRGLTGDQAREVPRPAS